jgi:hypothetical protein
MVVATFMGTDHEAGPEDHREDEDDAGNNHDQRRELIDPVRSVVGFGLRRI